MVYSRLSRRLRETGHALCQLPAVAGVAHGRRPSEQEWQEFVNCLTTNLTAFFREEHHFHALADDLRTAAGQPMRIWCNAASTGEEPYSIAMTVVETLGGPASTRICSDIDTKVLATAQRGVYDAEARGLSSPERLQAPLPARHRRQRRAHPRQAGAGALIEFRPST
jgi:chemotaxis protein methyltransferase CheR